MKSLAYSKSPPVRLQVNGRRRRTVRHKLTLWQNLAPRYRPICSQTIGLCYVTTNAHWQSQGVMNRKICSKIVSSAEYRFSLYPNNTCIFIMMESGTKKEAFLKKRVNFCGGWMVVWTLGMDCSDNERTDLLIIWMVIDIVKRFWNVL